MLTNIDNLLFYKTTKVTEIINFRKNINGLILKMLL